DGAAAQMAKTMSANTKGSFKELMSMLEELALQFYDALKPALEVVIDWLKQLTAWFQKLSPQAKTTIAVITGIAAVIGPLLIGFGFLIQGVMGVIKAFEGIVTAFKAVGTALNILRVAFMTIIEAIIIVVWLIIMHWAKIKEYLLKAWNWIKDTAASVRNGIKIFFSNVWNGIKNIVQSAVTWYLNRVKQNWQTIKPVTTS